MNNERKKIFPSHYFLFLSCKVKDATNEIILADFHGEFDHVIVIMHHVVFYRSLVVQRQN